jgi:uncharacterized protein
VRAILWLLCAIALAGCGAGQRGPFDYDAGAPLNVRVSFSHLEGGVRISELTYASPKGGRVPALLFVPFGRGPFAGLILQHGMPKEDAAPDAEDLAGLGAVVIAIDPPFVRPSGAPIPSTRRDRAEQIQQIVDLRRAVDLLRARADVDDDRIAYLGFSSDAAFGGLLAGVEHRIAAFVLMSGGGGSSCSGQPAEGRGWPPCAWVKRASAPLFFLFGRHDYFVSVRDQTRYWRAAPQPKEIRWYDSGHFLPPQAWCDAARFLGRQIGIAGSKEPECGH